MGPVDADRGGGIAKELGGLDGMELRFWLDVWETPVEEAVDEHGIEWARFGPVYAMTVAGAPEERTMNLVLGAAEPEAARCDHLDSALEWVGSRGVDHVVPVTPGRSGSAAAEDLLNRSGYEQTHRIVRLARDTRPPKRPDYVGVEIDEWKGEDDGLQALTFGELVAGGAGLAPWFMSSFFCSLTEHKDWRCYVAIDPGECSVAWAAMRIEDGIAQLGLAGTAPEARGMGFHRALVNRRLVDAAAAGCGMVFADVREPLGEPPSVARRNLLHAGFKQTCLRACWASPAMDRDELEVY